MVRADYPNALLMSAVMLSLPVSTGTEATPIGHARNATALHRSR